MIYDRWCNYYSMVLNEVTGDIDMSCLGDFVLWRLSRHPVFSMFISSFSINVS